MERALEQGKALVRAIEALETLKPKRGKQLAWWKE
jgi:hypothetical protein